MNRQIQCWHFNLWIQWQGSCNKKKNLPVQARPFNVNTYTDMNTEHIQIYKQNRKDVVYYGGNKQGLLHFLCVTVCVWIHQSELGAQCVQKDSAVSAYTPNWKQKRRTVIIWSQSSQEVSQAEGMHSSDLCLIPPFSLIPLFSSLSILFQQKGHFFQWTPVCKPSEGLSERSAS